MGELAEDRTAVALHGLGNTLVSRYAGVCRGVEAVAAVRGMNTRRLCDNQAGTTLCPGLVVGDETVVGPNSMV